MLTPFDQELQIGDRIANRYQILGIIGKGSMGIVYKARHVMMGRIVAIKMLRGQLVVDEKTVKRFEREGKAASRLDHPNLIQVYDFGLAENGQPYLVMDYVQGRTLYEIQRREDHINAERAVHIFSQVCDALYHAHLQGVIHRDLKPSNIMIVERPNEPELVKVFDLGVAKIAFQEETETEALTNTGEVCGSPVYLSPEQCRNETQDHRSDIYALGVVMYELLSGVPPILGATVYDTIYMHVYQQPLPLAAAAKDLHIPDRLERIVMKALEKNPEDRYQSMQELKWELQASLQLSDPNVKVLPPGAVSQLRKQRRPELPSPIEVEELKPRKTPQQSVPVVEPPRAQPQSHRTGRDRLSDANIAVSKSMKAIARTGQSPVFLICATAGITVGVTLTILSTVTGWHPGAVLNSTTAIIAPTATKQSVPAQDAEMPADQLASTQTKMQPVEKAAHAKQAGHHVNTKQFGSIASKKESKQEARREAGVDRARLAPERAEQTRLASSTAHSSDPGQSAWNSFLGIFQQGSSPPQAPLKPPTGATLDQKQPPFSETQPIAPSGSNRFVRTGVRTPIALTGHQSQPNTSPSSPMQTRHIDSPVMPAGGAQANSSDSRQEGAPAQPLPPLSVPPLEAVELNNEGVQLLKNGAPDAAIVKFQAALRQYPNYVKARANLGRAFANFANKSYSEGNIELAGDNYKLAIRTLNSSLGPNHQDTVNVQHMYAEFLRATGQ